MVKGLAIASNKSTICFSGSMKNPEIVRDMRRFQVIAELNGFMCFTPVLLGNLTGVDGETGYADILSNDMLRTFTSLHLKKILLSDILFVFDYNESIGEGTNFEIHYARAHGKTVRYMTTSCPSNSVDDFRSFLDECLKEENE